MLYSTKLVLLTIVVVVSGKANEEKIEKISSVIEKTSSSLQSTKSLIESSSPDFNSALKVVQEFADLGGIFFPQLKIFSASIGLLSGIIGGGESTDDKIVKGLTEIKESISHVEQMINGLVPQIRKDMIKQRFIQNIQNKVNNMQRLYNDFAKAPNKPQREALIDQCKGNAMKNILTEIHSEIVNGGEGNYNELLDGGERCVYVIFSIIIMYGPYRMAKKGGQTKPLCLKLLANLSCSRNWDPPIRFVGKVLFFRDFRRNFADFRI